MSNYETIPYKTYLDESEMPKFWYNVRADMKKKPAPLLNPATGKPMTAQELEGVFCKELVAQELDDETQLIPIPEEIRDFYKMYRPSPLVRAYCLEKQLGTPAHIYYKFEGNNTSGSHKLNSAIAQAYYAKHQGLKGVTTETGAGQWGTALSMACAYLGLDCIVFMVKVSYEQKPFRREVMRTYGARVTPSPSNTTEIGRKILADFPETDGSLGCAISEAVEYAVGHPGYRYVLGSVLNQVLLHQSVIGLETKTALDKLGVKATSSSVAPVADRIWGGSFRRLWAKSCAAKRLRIYCRRAGELPELHARQIRLRLLRYGVHLPTRQDVHPRIALYAKPNSRRWLALPRHEPRSFGALRPKDDASDNGATDRRFQSSRIFRPREGILPAPESAHAIKAAIDEALKCKETGAQKNIVFGLTGTGYFDMVAYGKYNDGDMVDYLPSDEDIEKALAQLPKV